MKTWVLILFYQLNITSIRSESLLAYVFTSTEDTLQLTHWHSVANRHCSGNELVPPILKKQFFLNKYFKRTLKGKDKTQLTVIVVVS